MMLSEDLILGIEFIRYFPQGSLSKLEFAT